MADAVDRDLRPGSAAASLPVGFEAHGTPAANSMSAPVRTAATPGICPAAAASMPLIRAWA